MICKCCGKELEDDNRFCIYCGKKLEEIDEKNIQFSQRVRILFISITVVCIIATILLVVPFNTKQELLSDEKLSILDCYLDWNSSYVDEKNGATKVDVIMYVSNDSDQDVLGFDFSAKDSKGNILPNLLDEKQSFLAKGYLKKHEKGIMVASCWLEDNKKKILASNIEITGAIVNEIDDYNVPVGTIVDAQGINKDYYTVELSNKNDSEISNRAIFVAALLKEGRIIDADATGRIDESIAANSSKVRIENVFQDPGFEKLYSEYKVYVIDIK